MRPIFPSSPAAAAPARTHRHWLRAGFFAIGLLVLGLVVTQMPAASSEASATIYADGGTVATKPVATARADHSLFTPGYFGMLGLLALGGLGAAYLKRRRSADAPEAGQLRALGHLALGQQQHVRMVACGDEVLVLGVTASSITLLKSYPADALTADAPAAASTATPSTPAVVRPTPLRRVMPQEAPPTPSFARLFQQASVPSAPRS